MDLNFETARLLLEEFQHEFCSPPKVNHSDSMIARQLQEQFEQEFAAHNSRNSMSTNLSDSLLARKLQEQFKEEAAIEKPTGNLVYDVKKKNKEDAKSLVDPSWEVIDPTPDVHVLFMAFNDKFFWRKLDAVCVSWSNKMKRCAGICSYQGRAGMCHITLSAPLLKLRPRKDLIETLLHEMIHAYLFVTNNNKDRDGHGPEFHKHMYRINNEAGTNITVYHDFHDEVELYLQHWWRCNGICQKWKPYFGIVRRSVNRAPGHTDRWWAVHSRNCGGTFMKIKSPEPKTKGTKGNKHIKSGKENQPMSDIRKYIPTINTTAISGNKPSTSVTNTSKIHTISKPTSGLSVSVAIPSKTNNIHGFSNISKTCEGTCGGQKGAVRDSNTIVINKKPSASTVTSGKSKIGTKSPSKFSNKTNVDIRNQTPTNYGVVRNHWINKFPTTENLSTKDLSSTSIKRKSSENFPPYSKCPKLNDTCSQDSLDCETVPCPVCNVSFLIEELNRHLDDCLNNPSDNQKECIVCSKKFSESVYQEHLNECLRKNFDDDIFEVQDSESDKDQSLILVDESMDLSKITCEVCNNAVRLDNMDDHVKICRKRNECPECEEIIEPDKYDLHLAECLIKRLDELEERYNKKEDKIEKPNSIRKKEMVDCLACGKNILKSELNCHLDECLNEVFKDEKSSKSETDNDDKMYNCPFCLKLVSETEMSDHIDVCLKTVDDDNEMQNNKSIFLSEMNHLNM